MQTFRHPDGRPFTIEDVVTRGEWLDAYTKLCWAVLCDEYGALYDAQVFCCNDEVVDVEWDTMEPCSATPEELLKWLNL